MTLSKRCPLEPCQCHCVDHEKSSNFHVLCAGIIGHTKKLCTVEDRRKKQIQDKRSHMDLPRASLCWRRPRIGWHVSQKKERSRCFRKDKGPIGGRGWNYFPPPPQIATEKAYQAERDNKGGFVNCAQKVPPAFLANDCTVASILGETTFLPLQSHHWDLIKQPGLVTFGLFGQIALIIQGNPKTSQIVCATLLKKKRLVP